LPETTGLRVGIYLDKNNVGLTTKRLMKQTLLILFGALIGSVFGIMSAVGGAMAFIEKRREVLMRKSLRVNRRLHTQNTLTKYQEVRRPKVNSDRDNGNLDDVV
jgi:hypothetical protein